MLPWLIFTYSSIEVIFQITKNEIELTTTVMLEWGLWNPSALLGNKLLSRLSVLPLLSIFRSSPCRPGCRPFTTVWFGQNGCRKRKEALENGKTFLIWLSLLPHEVLLLSNELHITSVGHYEFFRMHVSVCVYIYMYTHSIIHNFDQLQYIPTKLSIQILWLLALVS